MIRKFQRETPNTYLQIGAVKIYAFEVGLVSSIFSKGGSVERAIAAKVSMMRLIQSSWTAFRGDSPKKIIPKMTRSRTETLTVS